MENFGFEFGKFLILNILVFLKKFSKFKFYPEYIRIKDLYFDKDFNIKINFLKKFDICYNKEIKTSIFYLGIISLQILFSNFVDNIINLLSIVLKNNFVKKKEKENKRDNKDFSFLINLKTFFSLKEKFYLNVNHDLQYEYCCFYHFLLGKRRFMTKSNKIEEEIKKNNKINEEIIKSRIFLKKYIKKFYNEDLENFLCFTTRFLSDERISIDQAKNHMFLKDFEISIFKKKKKNYLLSTFNLFVKNEKIDVPKFYAMNIFKALCNYYKQKGKRNFVLESPLIQNEEISDDIRVLNMDSDEIEFLHYELGIDKIFLWDKIKEMIESNYKLIDF